MTQENSEPRMNQGGTPLRSGALCGSDVPGKLICRPWETKKL
jgi:hypothetical protein